MNQPTIGPFTLESPLLLAPMAGVADAPFREICRDYGASFSTSEMLTSDINLWHQPKSQWRLKWANNEKPISIQIAGTDPELMAQAAQACQALGAQIIDINMGCPAKKVCKKMAGSALMAQEDLVYAIVKAVVNRFEGPVTVKTRTGSNPVDKNAIAVGQACESAGAQAITIHGRTRACKFMGHAEHHTVKAVKQALSIPVFANGDIKSAKEAKCILDETCVDGIMIGRGALGRPWIFRQINEYLIDGVITFQPDAQETLEVIERHVCSIHGFYGREAGVRIARKHVLWYLQYLHDAELFCKAFVRLQTCEDQLRALERFFETLAMEKC